MPSNASMKNESLYASCRRGDIARIRAFVESSRAINEADPQNGMTLLHYACHGNQAEIVELLCTDPLQDVNAQDNDGWTALHFAADRGNAEIVSRLIHFGARGAITDKFQKTALHYAAGNGSCDVVQLLIAAFPHIRHMKSLAEKSPYDLAIANHQESIVDIIGSP